MLLPSVFPCEPSTTVMRPRRPPLPTFGHYESDFILERSTTPILASCRALQNLIGGTLPSPRTPKAISTKTLRNPFEVQCARITKPGIGPPPPRGANKRRRNEYEEDIEQPNQQRLCDEQVPTNEANDGCSTPKRQRRIPMYMPLGLTAEDFRSLETPRPERHDDRVISIPSLCSPELDAQSSDHDSGYGPSPVSEDNEQVWTIDDDRILVETVLEKLRLSKRDWNNCARMLGKDKDSIGRRWRLLVDEGNVGLRRGGRIRRTHLEIESW